MKKQILYWAALLWCGLKNYNKRNEYRGWSAGLREHALGEHGLVKSGCDGEYLKMYIAKPGHKLGYNNEYLAYISGLNFHVMSARTDEEYVRFWQVIDQLGLDYEYEGENESCKWYRVRESVQNFLFWYKKDLPKGCKPILLMSNGGITKGYWRRVGNLIEVYRPNPNAWEVYHPFDTNKFGWNTWRMIHSMIML